MRAEVTDRKKDKLSKYTRKANKQTSELEPVTYTILKRSEKENGRRKISEASAPTLAICWKQTN